MEDIKYLYFKIIMDIDGEEYLYGRETDRNKANEIAMRVREERGCDVWVLGEVDQGLNKLFFFWYSWAGAGAEIWAKCTNNRIYFQKICAK